MGLFPFVLHCNGTPFKMSSIALMTHSQGFTQVQICKLPVLSNEPLHGTRASGTFPKNAHHLPPPILPSELSFDKMSEMKLVEKQTKKQKTQTTHSVLFSC